MQCTPLAGCGALVEGLDVRRPLDAEDREWLAEAIRRHRLLVLRDQDLGPDDQIRVLGHLGPVVDEKEDGTFHSFVSNADPDALVRGDNRFPYHTDFGFTNDPPWFLSLYGIEVVEGANTLYADTVAAARGLPDDLRAAIGGRHATLMYSFDVAYNRDYRLRLADLPSDAPTDVYPRTVHPVLDVHPRTGEELLRVSEQQTSHVEGLDEPASEALIAAIFEHLYSPAFTYEHEWRPGDLVVWDNLAVQHGRRAFPVPHTRRLRRVCVSPKTFGEIMAGMTVPEGFGARAVVLEGR